MSLGPSLKIPTEVKTFETKYGKNNLPKKLFINNEYVESKNAKKLELYNPKNGELVANDVSLAGEEDVEAAVAAAEAAFPAWRKVAPRERRDMMLKLADLLEANGLALAELTRLTLGAPFGAFGSFEINLCAEALRYFAGWIDKFAGETYPQDDGFLKIVRNEPLGVTAGIIPWNGPIGNVGMKAGPALATGNCFILKPSEKTPFAALALGDMIRAAGFPPGVFQILTGDGATGALLASHMKVRKISFTGSTATGRKIQEMAARSNLKRVTLELGGKSPAVVFDDANLDNAITWCANGITANTGQVCFAASRVYVQAGIYDQFVAGYKKAMEDKMRGVGDPDAEQTIIGPLVDKLQFDRVSGFLQRGKAQGTLLVGGSVLDGKGYYVQPTVFENVGDDAEILRSEIFGPVAVLNKFTTEEEIVAKANDTNYGLMAGVFTQDINRAMRLSAEIDSGMVGVNCVSMCFLNAPFGGTKESGVGRENAINALRMFTDTKTVFVNLTY
ncbi:aldehyde dehydrogenase (NAD+) [Sporothrix brasiliensis 5110]|uniref:aldehyde dehydrogenase (NAD(+)) n=1 Tax=Sporothrix brasiliensis 5110 TaxID=1398154 RepID=A0A0C2IE54_9PEZI|nr:aldehyde dehydrogenase (NAD+) [Sporothrix brasiliensis 5110]KIH87546.1 aldehyde dehydrogenase (NAD+) [Sporothrix brasiliensis 5110]